MPTPDDALRSRGSRRPLGRGPGTAYEAEPAAVGSPDEPAAPVPAPVAHSAPPAPVPAEHAAPAPEPGEPSGDPEEAAGPAAGEARPEGPAGPAAAAEGEQEADDGRFRVVLDNFEGPFDLLLQLISKHKLDVTEVALSRVTDEFMAHIHAMGPEWDLDQTTEFLVVAATLLDLKAARLLPQAEVEDEADLALLEARDLLFARLLQYRAYKEIANIFAARLDAEARRHPRTVGLEPHHAELLPEVALSVGPEGFARLAVKAMRPKPKPQVYVEHIHAPLVSVREQAEVVVARLRERGEASFQELTRDAPDTLTVVARFLALLELYRERAVALDQDEALGALLVRWSGTADAGDGTPLVTDEFDQEPGERKDD
ncbi:segregation and condensation protein A [Streptomyces sp. AA1529]|uniref:segregation and condensation protein A n=1 Tax=Streptomyces sp. AA1529 TaxID=1203257 RepID=UPI0004745474|nr:ScpA family protein [Streptomyces sp. AA1529]